MSHRRSLRHRKQLIAASAVARNQVAGCMKLWLIHQAQQCAAEGDPGLAQFMHEVSTMPEKFAQKLNQDEQAGKPLPGDGVDDGSPHTNGHTTSEAVQEAVEIPIGDPTDATLELPAPTTLQGGPDLPRVEVDPKSLDHPPT